MRNKVIKNRGPLKKIVIEMIWVLVNIDFPEPTSKSEGMRWGNKKNDTCDNARKRIEKKKKGK